MIYFVTESFLKDKTHITQNVDAKDLSPYIEMVVRTYIQPILGYNFTNDLLVKFNSGATSADEDELIEFVQYVTAFYSAYDAIPNLSFRVSNKGVQSQFSDYSASDGIQAVEYIRNNVMKFAKIHEGNMRKWLDLNKAKFPLYTSSTNKEIDAPEMSVNFKSDTSFL